MANVTAGSSDISELTDQALAQLGTDAYKACVEAFEQAAAIYSGVAKTAPWTQQYARSMEEAGSFMRTGQDNRKLNAAVMAELLERRQAAARLQAADLDDDGYWVREAELNEAGK